VFDTAIVTDEGHTRYYLEREGFRRRGQALFSLVYEHPEWFHRLHWEAKGCAVALFDYSREIKGSDYNRMDDAGLVETAADFLEKYHRAQDHGVLMSMLEFDHEIFTKYLLDYINNLRREQKMDVEASHVFSTLTTSTHDTQGKKFKLSELELLTRICAEGSLRTLFETREAHDIIESLPSASPALSERLESHYEAFCWLPYGPNGPAWTREEIVRSIQNVLRDGTDPRSRLNELTQEQAQVREQQELLYKALKVDEHHKRLFVIAQDSVYLKALRKDATSYGFYCAEKLFRQAAKRMGLAMSQLRMLFPEELLAGLTKGGTDAGESNARIEASVYLIRGGGEEFLTGEAARGLIEEMRRAESPAADRSELLGTCAVAGRARGRVKIVNSPADIPKMEKGDILVSYVTDVNLEPAMIKAAAIVTDSGGMTSHASIFAREFGITCVVGTKVSTKVLCDGDEVEVDADRGLVLIIERAR
jgi:phosphohistidine swiveling domain-containing protein